MSKNIARIRVEVNPKEEDRGVAFKRMFMAFKSLYKEDGIARAFRQHETYESKSRKKRRKRREAESLRLKMLLKENILQGNK